MTLFAPNRASLRCGGAPAPHPLPALIFYKPWWIALWATRFHRHNPASFF